MTRPGRKDPPDMLGGWGKGFAAWMVFCALVALGFLGLIAWAIVEIVSAVTR